MPQRRTPMSQQIAAELRRDIQAGNLSPGALLPSERELIERYETTKSTVGKAIAILRAQGLVTSQVGRGIFVRKPRQKLRRDHSARYQWEKDRARLPADERKKACATEFDTGLKLTDLTFHAEYSTAEATKELAERFSVQVSTELLRRDYWTAARSEITPLNMVTSYIPYEIASGNPALLDPSNEPWPGGTQSQLFTVGIELDRIVDELTARLPLPDEAEFLDLEAGVAVLVLHKTSVDTTGRVVEFSEVILPGDRTEVIYTTRLARWSQ